MRYDNWDVILFPKDSLVPIQEFRTACYIPENDEGRPLPTLACYISSQPPRTPFRISIHSWVAPVKPSPLIESLRKQNQRVVYTVQVVVDGSRIFHGFYETGTKWPQEIVNEKRSIHEPMQIRRHGPFLDFPPFHLNVRLQTSWNARESEGRIKILLSEQLVRKTNHHADLELGASNHIVCFAFQHAPRDILEQSGIAWPIHNPLCLSTLQGSEWPPSSRMHITKPRDFSTEPTFASTRNTEPHVRSRANLPPSSQWPKAPEKDLRPSVWDTSMANMYGSDASNKPLDVWNSTPTHHRGVNGSLPKNGNQVIVTLRDDQLGQLIEAMSPPKKQYGHGLVVSGTGLPSKMPDFVGRSSTAALARKASYSDPNVRMENKSPLDSSRELRPQDPYPDSSGIFVSRPFDSHAGRKDSDISMRDPSSVFSTVPTAHRSSPALVPSARGNVQSRKEGQVGVSSTLNAGQIQSLLPEMGHPKSIDERQDGATSNDSALTVDEEHDFMPGHKCMSSVDSTARLERQLFSALGEELAGFHEETLEEPSAVSMPDDFGTPVTKRKRQGTFGDGEQSPLSKVAKEDNEVPHLRGGV